MTYGAILRLTVFKTLPNASSALFTPLLASMPIFRFSKGDTLGEVGATCVSKNITNIPEDVSNVELLIATS